MKEESATEQWFLACPSSGGPYTNYQSLTSAPGRWKRGCGDSIDSHSRRWREGGVPFRWLNEKTRFVEFKCGCRGHIAYGVDVISAQREN